MKRVKCVKVENLFGYWKFNEGDEYNLIQDGMWLIIGSNGTALFVKQVNGQYIGGCLEGTVAIFEPKNEN